MLTMILVISSMPWPKVFWKKLGYLCKLSKNIATRLRLTVFVGLDKDPKGLPEFGRGKAESMPLDSFLEWLDGAAFRGR